MSIAKLMSRFDNPSNVKIGDKWRIAKKSIIKRKPWICGLCKKIIHTRGDLTIDHIVPLSHGGSNHSSNLQAAHYICNQMKGNSRP